MKRLQVLLLTFACVFTIQCIAISADPPAPFLHVVPLGVAVESSVEAPADKTEAIGRKLGGEIQRLTNSFIRVHGRPIQINTITAVDEANAISIHTAIEMTKPFPFCLRKENVVVEYVGQNIDSALAIKTSYELGLIEMPLAVRYRVTAELATVEKADYMACNILFNHFLALERGSNPDAARQIDETSKRFTFGRNLVLRNPTLDGRSTKYTFDPPAIGASASDATIVYTFGELATRQNVPFVKATMDITVNSTGFHESPASPPEQLVAATPFWPANDPTVISLARRITDGKSTNSAKAMAILEWLTPGQNLKYSGQTGSRWGTDKVFEQKFGHCWDFSDCFITLARAAGVPSRQVAGWFYGSSGHVWAEFYREGKGWQQVDPTGGGKLMCGIYHVPYFSSNNGEMPIVYVSMPKIETIETNELR